ncbi:Signal transduction response regulator, SKN7-like protein [Cordyceps fumosorosea ARSEF 2679]|uniref:Transcription factor n=1 Tax=Cordyceps fumosorosea (strain ARSEF 2679) TaxID=1081104 RepID=A0A168EBV0_CORFA|nr:Signal transduction response regulator, SKN7-like protein [Cordyceps fumosorosea ARSEF 2679]OAA73625.1 Signal transduction response regulator, SKN7-like protein [Cordyceps fumosorosea ARSEF 2679]
MSGTDAGQPQGSGNNASEFVRKLFKMLEDPSHQDVARWGKDGDTFVVEEVSLANQSSGLLHAAANRKQGEKFTRSILPKHFKHSNMSSFIRQLNKYDFHKVKPSADADASNPSGNVLEFKHPYFRVDSKDDLDNIRRKAPAPRKPQPPEDFTTSQHVSVISEQLTATQQQVQQLQELFSEVSQANRLLINEVMTLQKMLNAQKGAQHEMLNYLTGYPGRTNAMMSRPMASNGAVPQADAEEIAPELRRARELLASVTPNVIADRELERLHDVYGPMTDSSAMITPVTMPMLHDPITDLSRYPVYPVGQTVGIDPFASDHIQKLPYAMPGEAAAATATALVDHHHHSQQHTPTSGVPTPVMGAAAPTNSREAPTIWGGRKPLVFLVEDDPTCAKIGKKFLRSMGCEVEHAPDGAEAFNRVNNPTRDRFDLIFMDIIMPKLDGVSASMYIRQQCPSTPIIAMTSNIRPDEVNSYFEHGMNGVLAKPFTKEGMLKSVKTNLAHMLKNPPPTADGTGAFIMPAIGFIDGGTPVKLEAPTPGSGNSWANNGMPQGEADHGYGMVNGAAPFPMAGSSRTAYAAGMDGPSGRMVPDHESPPEKRQRLNNSQGNFA